MDRDVDAGIARSPGRSVRPCLWVRRLSPST